MYRKYDKKETQNSTDLYVISDFPRGVHENCPLFLFYAS